VAAVVLRDPPQVVGVEWRIRRHLLSTAFLPSCHRIGLKQVCLPRRPTSVRCVDPC
uniref:Uncharacterized protein n=1 Tax=Balaenoptera musculus TaxID=9771 RepID=A0A8C0DKF5_BALMU